MVVQRYRLRNKLVIPRTFDDLKQRIRNVKVEKPLRTKARTRAAGVIFETKLTPTRFGTQAGVKFEVVIKSARTGKPIPAAPLEIFLDGKLVGRKTVDAQGKATSEFKFFERSDEHEIIVFFLGRLTTRFFDVVSTTRVFQIREIELNATDEFTGDSIPVQIDVATSGLTQKVLSGRRILIPVIDVNQLVTIKYPIETDDGRFGLFDLVDSLETVISGGIRMSKKYRLFENLTVTEFNPELECEIEVTGEPLSRIRSIGKNKFKALRGTEIIMNAIKPDLPDTLFLGWLSNNEFLQNNLISLTIPNGAVESIAVCVRTIIDKTISAVNSSKPALHNNTFAVPNIMTSAKRLVLWDGKSPVRVIVRGRTDVSASSNSQGGPTTIYVNQPSSIINHKSSSIKSSILIRHFNFAAGTFPPFNNSGPWEVDVVVPVSNPILKDRRTITVAVRIDDGGSYGSASVTWKNWDVIYNKINSPIPEQLKSLFE